ncbi:hypothetical protein T03_2604, partial [Trichinella britovi]
MEQRKCENTDGTKQNKRRQEHQKHLRSVRINSSSRKFSNQLKPVSIATDRLKIALSSISNGALVCFTCVPSNSIVKRQTLAL